ncbi:MAG: YjbH domain-containing protein [Methanosarcina thermophila]
MLGGYINMPSARMSQEGQIGLGYAEFPTYQSYNLRMQMVDFLEISGFN